MKSKIIRLTLGGLFGAVLLSSPASTEEKQLIPGDFSANVGVFSDYTFRGTSQTGNEPAIQGGIDYSLDTGVEGIGIYLGTWASNVDFSDGDQASIEIDWYGGISKTFGGVDVSAGFLYYTYPGATSSLNYDFLEGTLGLGFGVSDNLSLGVNYAYSGDYFGASGTEHYFQATAEYTVPVKGMSLTLDAAVGRQLIQDNTTFGTPDYTDWRIGASLGITENVGVTVFYTDTDLSTADCFGGGNTCDTRGQVGLTASF